MGARGPVGTAGAAVVAVVALALVVGLGLVLGSSGSGGGSGTSAPVLVGTAAAEPDRDPSSAPPEERVWSGPLREQGGPTVDVRLAMTGTPGGPRPATLDVPALGCRYTGTTPPGDPAVVVLRTVTDPQELCAARATVRLTALSDRTMRYELVSSCARPQSHCMKRSAAALLSSPR